MYHDSPHLFSMQQKQVELRLVMCITMQIMPELIILGCIYALPAYRDLMRAEGPKHIPIY